MVHPFLRELTSKVVRLYYDNQAVGGGDAQQPRTSPCRTRADVTHACMPCLWILLDQNDIELQQARCAATVVAPYSRSKEGRQQGTLRRRGWCEAASKVKVYWPVDDAWYTSIDAALDLDIGELGDSSLTELAVQMQGTALGSKTVSNYQPNSQAFMNSCVAEGHQWLPTTKAMHGRCGRSHLLGKGTVQALI
ncbi:hypothetical protein CYMTET_52014 [Cymbomonas tetramitiformis]|uniref:Uncharacterized protein n=1 Tax=Cymbomonas tetramitiformis TaxID=36881 RepID=A0AAE0ES24_9CHLO|nr:hypothetical protein CYMTET_52014 [Cymbomonas tetramitiformis]